MIKSCISIFEKLLDFIKAPIKNWQSLSSDKYNNDKKIFDESNEILNEEQMLYLLNCAYNLRFSQKQSEQQQNYIYYFLETENINDKIISKIYNDKNLQKLHNEFLTGFLNTFKHIDWCVSERNDNFIELNPNLKKRNINKYFEEVNVIRNFSSNALKAYKKYREKIKQKFGI